MKHRYLDSDDFSLPAIDSYITRGRVHDWIELKSVAENDPEILVDILRISLSGKDSPYDAHLYHYWECWSYRHLSIMNSESLWYKHYHHLKSLSSYEQQLFIEMARKNG